jgi:hypothetical protein
MQVGKRATWIDILLALAPFVIAGMAKSLESSIINAPSVWTGAERIDEWSLLKAKALPAVLCVVPFLIYRRSVWPIWLFTWAGLGAEAAIRFASDGGDLLIRRLGAADYRTVSTIWRLAVPAGALLIVGWGLERRCRVKWGWYLPLIFVALTGPLGVLTQRAFDIGGRIPDVLTWCTSALSVALLWVDAYVVWRLVRQTPSRGWFPASLVMLGLLGTQRSLWSTFGPPTEQLVTVAAFFLIPAVIAVSLRASEGTARLKWLAGGLLTVWALAVVAEHYGFSNWIAFGSSVPWMLYGFGLNVFIPLAPALYDWNMKRRQAAALNSGSPPPTGEAM